ncbi:beta-class carbonic anhydrase [Propionicicella superfundia]|uniref:beta-class carbonic anhydrase n=1 Tax=Propionicicella superfundia TaxID=348582 RepID=UPI0003FE62EE|nr:carbonic anhydrase [Propionicicella superfundia]
MTTIDEVVAANAAYADHAMDFVGTAAPSRQLAVVTCMDARIDPYNTLGLRAGEAHVIRNAGGIVTDDVLRSLAVSQRKLGTVHVMLVMHTDCGMGSFEGDAFRHDVEVETGLRPQWAVETFHDVDAEVRQGMARIRAESAVRHLDDLRGFVFDVVSRRLREILPA